MRPHQEAATKTTTTPDAKIKSNKCKLVKSVKPLVNYKFYLDIERHNVFLKIESKIRELGGSIEFFLTKDITHFITDKSGQTESDSESVINSPQSPVIIQTPPSISNYLSPVVNTPSSNDLKGNSKIKSRADAMLHRARKRTCEIIDKTQLTYANPSQIAESWGIPVWHTEYALKFLEKVYLYIKERYIDNTKKNIKSLKQQNYHHYHHHKSKNAQILKGNYIKIESFHKQYRPYYKIFNSKWPVLNLKSQKKGVFPLTDDYITNNSEKTIIDKKEIPLAVEFIESIFKKTTADGGDQGSKMTRKTRTSKHIRIKNTSNKQASSEKQCGFCEICRVEYDALTVHLKSESHLNFSKNENNFLALDSLIKSSANMDRFLSINNKNIFGTSACDIYSPSKRTSKRISNSQLKLPLPRLPPNHTSQFTRDRFNHEDQIGILERKTTGQSRQTRQSFTRPNFCETIGIVRAKRESLKKINYAEPKEDEENSADDIAMELQNKKLKSKDKIDQNSSPEVKKLSLPTSLLYKVVETNDKSSKCMTSRDLIIDQKNNEQRHQRKCEKKMSPLIVKIRKVRQSELSILSGEAANFMFPKKLSSSELTDIDRQTSSDRVVCNNSVNVINEFVTEGRELLKRKKSNSSFLDELTRKKRRIDVKNEDYTECKISDDDDDKEEASGVKIRLSPRLTLRKRKSPIRTYKKRKATRRKFGGRKRITKKRTKGSKKIPKTSAINEIVNEKLKKYKFAFERVPDNEMWYQVFNRQDEGCEKVFEYYGNTIYQMLPYEMGPLPPLTKPSCSLCHINKTRSSSNSLSVEATSTENKSSSEKETKTSQTKEREKSSIENINESEQSSMAAKRERRSLNRAAALLNLEMPRKSPREHASTLAILSCLFKKKSNIASTPASESQISIKNEVSRETAVKTELNNLSNEICTQISENVKRLRRGEKSAISIPNSVTISSSRKLPLENKKKTKQKKTSLSSKSIKIENDENKMKKLCTEKYIDMFKLKNDIDKFLTVPEDDDLLKLPNPLQPQTDESIPFSQDVNLCDLISDDDQSIFTNIGKINAASNSRLRLYKIYSTNKKRKNKTGWPTTKKRTTTRQQVQQQENETLKEMSVLKSETKSATIANKRIYNKYQKHDNHLRDVSTHSPITPPESDDNEHKVDDGNELKNTCDVITATNLSHNHHKHHHHPNIHHYHQHNVHNFNTSDKMDASDIFTVSSDSLDTVLDVGSQIKTEDQEKIILNRKCNGNKLIITTATDDNGVNDLNQKISPLKKYKKRTKFSNYLNRVQKNSTTKTVNGYNNINSENGSGIISRKLSNNSVKEDNSSSTRSRNCKTSDELKLCEIGIKQESSSPGHLPPSPSQTSAISPRRLRKPRGKWYRER